MRETVGLGRVAFFDPRNLDHMIADATPTTPEDRKLAVLAARDPAALTVHAEGTGIASEFPRALAGVSDDAGRLYKYHNADSWWGDQGSSSQCTAYASLKAMRDGPVTHPGVDFPDPTTLYREIVAEDRAAGRYYTEGATSLAMARVWQRRGFIASYRWGYSLSEFLTAIRSGPVLLGVNWYEGMDDPDPKHGIIRAIGRNRGGHEIVANGVDLAGGVVRLANSWGREWGSRGFAYLPLEDLAKLIAEDGDVLIFQEARSDDPRTKRDESKE
jgi:hypothetical protein